MLGMLCQRVGIGQKRHPSIPRRQRFSDCIRTDVQFEKAAPRLNGLVVGRLFCAPSERELDLEIVAEHLPPGYYAIHFQTYASGLPANSNNTYSDALPSMSTRPLQWP